MIFPAYIYRRFTAKPRESMRNLPDLKIGRIWKIIASKSPAGLMQRFPARRVDGISRCREAERGLGK